MEGYTGRPTLRTPGPKGPSRWRMEGNTGRPTLRTPGPTGPASKPSLPSRRLEVVVLAARGLNTVDENGKRSRRSVELALICPTDSTGEEFGTKTSPWVLPSKASNRVWLGKSGLRAGFPLEGMEAPPLASEKRFLRRAELRIRFYTSGLHTASPTLTLAQHMLPLDLAKAAADALHNTARQLEAETRISLEDMLASEPDAYRNGWIDLQRTNIVADLAVPQVWMQVFVLPDQAKHVTKLNADYEAEGRRMPNFRPCPCSWVDVQPVSSRAAAATCVDTSTTLAISSTGTGQVAPQAASEWCRKCQQVVVPLGINPSDFFMVHGVVLEHIATCPPDKRAGDTWHVVSPTTNQLIIVEIPPETKPGQDFIVKEVQTRQAQCPEGASTHDTIQLGLATPLTPPTPSQDAMQAVCPVGKGLGESPNGLQPNGFQLAIATALDPASDLLRELTETWGMPCESNSVADNLIRLKHREVNAANSPPMLVPNAEHPTPSVAPALALEAPNKTLTVNLIMAVTPQACPPVKDPDENFGIAESLMEGKAQTPPRSIDYAQQAQDLRPKVDFGSLGKLCDVKFVPLDHVGRGIPASELNVVEVFSEGMSVQTLQDEALAGLSQTIRNAANERDERICPLLLSL